MLRELDRDAWRALLGLAPETVPRALVLRGTRNLKDQYRSHAARFDRVRAVVTPNGVLEDVFCAELGGVPVAYASVYGAPMAAEVAHAFCAAGTPWVVQTGCCGALDPALEVGELFFARGAVCGEGASRYYGAPETVAAEPPAPGAAFPGVPVRAGRLYTTSALFAQSKAEMAAWLARGCAAVDMETAAAFAVAAHFGAKRAALLYVFDRPGRDSTVLSQETDLNARRRAGEAAMVEAVLRWVRRLD